MQMTSRSAHVRVKVIDSFTPAARSEDFIMNRTRINLLLQAARCWSLRCLLLNTHTQAHTRTHARTKGVKENYLFAKSSHALIPIKAPPNRAWLLPLNFIHPCAAAVRKSTRGVRLTWRRPSSRLHQWHGSPLAAFLGGSPHSANQDKQATLYLVITPASVPHLSSWCESLQTRAPNTCASESHPAQFGLPSGNFIS